MAVEQCAECGNTFRSQLLWKSEITFDDFESLQHLTQEQLEEMAEQLDTVVMAICQDWGLE